MIIQKNKGKTFVAKAVNYSMAPVIQQGDITVVSLVPSRHVSVGDIAVYYRNKKFVSHRVVAKFRDTFLIKGDNVKHFDSMVKGDAIIGKISEIKGNNGHLDFTKKIARVIAVYYLFYSIIVFLFPARYSQFLRKNFRGRRFLIRTLLASR